jgi:hypothetical protein
VRRQHCAIAAGGSERLGIAVDLEHALGAEVIFDAGLFADLLQRLQAVESEAQIGGGVGHEARLSAVGEERGTPAQDMRKRLEPEQHWRVLAPKPL